MEAKGGILSVLFCKKEPKNLLKKGHAGAVEARKKDGLVHLP